jgi:ferrous iron transport protein A
MPERSMPLSLVGAGKILIVTGVVGGWGMRRRLADMGLIPGAQVMVMNGCHPGPLLIDIRGSRLGLGFGVAQKIMVKEVKGEQKANCGRPGRQP